MAVNDLSDGTHMNKYSVTPSLPFSYDTDLWPMTPCSLPTVCLVVGATLVLRKVKAMCWIDVSRGDYFFLNLDFFEVKVIDHAFTVKWLIANRAKTSLFITERRKSSYKTSTVQISVSFWAGEIRHHNGFWPWWVQWHNNVTEDIKWLCLKELAVPSHASFS